MSCDLPGPNNSCAAKTPEPFQIHSRLFADGGLVVAGYWLGQEKCAGKEPQQGLPFRLSRRNSGAVNSNQAHDSINPGAFLMVL